MVTNYQGKQDLGHNPPVSQDGMLEKDNSEKQKVCSIWVQALVQLPGIEKGECLSNIIETVPLLKCKAKCQFIHLECKAMQSVDTVDMCKIRGWLI